MVRQGALEIDILDPSKVDASWLASVLTWRRSPCGSIAPCAATNERSLSADITAHSGTVLSTCETAAYAIATISAADAHALPEKSSIRHVELDVPMQENDDGLVIRAGHQFDHLINSGYPRGSRRFLPVADPHEQPRDVYYTSIGGATIRVRITATATSHDQGCGSNGLRVYFAMYAEDGDREPAEGLDDIERM